MLRYVFIFAVVLALIGCTKPVSPPRLPGDAAPEIGRIALSDTLTVSDVRAIFRALNRTGSLVGLKPFIEDPSDRDLEDVMGIFSKYVYEEAQLPRGVLALFKNRVQIRAFSAWNERSKTWSRETTFREEMRAGHFIASHSAFPNVARRFSTVLDPAWSSIVAGTFQPVPQQPPRFSTADWLSDIEAFLNSPNGIADSQHLVEALQRHSLLDSTLRSIKAMQGGRGETPFENLSAELRRFLTETATDPMATNQLEQLLLALQHVNGAPNGIFRSIADSIDQSPNAVQFVITRLIRPWVENTVVDVIHHRIIGNPRAAEFWANLPRRTEGNYSREFLDLFDAIRRAISDVRGPASEDNAFAHNVPTITNAFALTSWLAFIASENRTSGNLTWSQSIRSPLFRLNYRLEATRNDLARMRDIGTFVQQLGNFVDQPENGTFLYVWEFADRNLTFGEALRLSIRQAHLIRPISEPQSFFRALLLHLSIPDSSSVALSEWERIPNLLESIHRFLSIQTDRTWDIVSNFLFRQLGIGIISEDTRNAFLNNFYPGTTPLRSRVEFLLKSLPIFQRASERAANGRSLLDFYLDWLRFIAPANLAAVGNAVVFLSNHHFLKVAVTDGDFGRPQFRPLYEFLASPVWLPFSFKWLTRIAERDEAVFLRGLSSIVSPERPAPFSELLTLANGTLSRHRPGVEAWLTRWRETDSTPFKWIDEWIPDERVQAIRLIESGDFEKLLRFLLNHGSIGSARQLVRELKNLSEKQSLRDAFTLLSGIRNERMKLIALTLLDWERSGELRKSLEAAETLLAPLD